jgi:hypothetical protein
MTAYNVVRFRTRPGQEQAFVDAHKNANLAAKGFRGGALVKTGERSFCLVGEWDDTSSLAAARPQMIATLDRFRHMLDDLGGGLGVTDPVSGSVVASLRGSAAAPRKPARKAARKPARKPRKKTAKRVRKRR